ncbi:MAG: hypothetical protein J7647_29710 [Cyanobacteria bacterium SBLK]|nr:hypothetical protein [Cyanobacteria bacterium SBLK]
MEIEPVNGANPEISSEQFEQLKEQVKLLPEEKRQELAMFLLGSDSGLNVVIGTNITNSNNNSNNINNSNGVILQIRADTDSEQISEDLKQISPEAMSELIRAIGKLIGEGSISFGDE